MKKKGFTLVELLAVIVILAIILVIVIPKVIGVLNSAKLSALDDTIMMISSQGEKEYISRT